MPVPYPPITDDPRVGLRGFLLYVQQLLDELTNDADPPARSRTFVRARLIAPLADVARDAWREAKPIFDELATRVTSVSDSALGDHGLRGSQLRFKLETVRFFNEQYSAVGRKILKKLIDVIDILLKSILAVVGAGEGAAEIKDYIKESLDLDD